MMIKQYTKKQIIFFTFSFLLGLNAFAAEKTAPRGPKEEMMHFLQFKKSPSVQALKQGWLFFEKKAYDKALQELKKVKEKAYLQDALWDRFHVYLAMEDQNPSAQHVFLKKALDDMVEFEARYPRSGYFKKTTELRTETELKLALLETMADKKKALFERSFERKLPVVPFSLTTLDAIRDYASTCENDPAMACTAWIKKISLILEKTPQEADGLRLIFNKLPYLKIASFRSARLDFIPYKAPDLDFSALDLAIKCILEKKWDEASHALEQALKTYPRSSLKKNMIFWSAFILDQQSKPEEAKALRKKIIEENPLSAQAIWVTQQDRLNHDVLINPGQGIAWQDRCEGLNYFELQILKKAESLISVGLLEKAALLLKELRVQESWSNEFLYYVLFLNGFTKSYLGVWTVVAEFLIRNVKWVQPPEVLGLIFPFEYWDVIKKIAHQIPVDPLLMLSLMKQESAFDPFAISSSGAIGLSQVMPATAYLVNNKVSSRDLWVPEKNIQIGMKYLQQMIHRFNGNIALALAAYNAGPQAVERWVKEGKAPELLLFLELIPYRQTREYVATIIRNYFWYAYFLKQDVKEGLAFFWKSELASEKE